MSGKTTKALAKSLYYLGTFLEAWASTIGSLLGSVAVTIGAYMVYHPAGWIVGGALIVLASELPAIRARDTESTGG